jgi:hypothetical protein
MRLEEGFLGYETTDDRGAGQAIGVAHFGDDLKTNSATTRAQNGDFSKIAAKSFRGISPEERPWLFVVKKQKTVLTELLNWLQIRVADATDTDGGRKLITKLPLLMIDDEADNATTALPDLDALVGRLPADVRETLEELFRVRFQAVRRIPRKALVNATVKPPVQ